MYHSNHQPTYPQNVPFQQLQPHQSPVPSFQQQQFGSRFQTPAQQFTSPPPTPGSFYPCPPPHHDNPRPQFPIPVQHQPFYQTPSPVFDKTPKNQQSLQNFENLQTPSYQLPMKNFRTPPNSQYQPSSSPNFNQLSVPLCRIPGPSVQNYNQPPPVQNFNQPPVQNYDNHCAIQNFNQPPPVQYYSQSYQPVNQNCHQQMTSSYQSPSPRFSPSSNTSFHSQVQSPEMPKKLYNLPADQCYQQQQSSFNLPKHKFNQRLPGQQRFPLKNLKPRYNLFQHSNNGFQFHPRQQYQNYRPRGPYPTFNNESNGNFVPKKDKPQIACEMGDCDFVGHASAVKEHQNLHHRLGLHKKVLYSNNSDAVKNWIEERKKKWPTKETIQTKLEVEDEKNKRGERIADEDFQRFNNKKNKFNNSGSRRFNNNKRQRFNGEFVEPVEEPMNGNLKRFAGISNIIKEEEISMIDKPVALKLLEEYEEPGDNQSDDDPPEETVIVKESAQFVNNNLNECNEKQSLTLEMEGVLKEHNTEVISIPLIENNIKASNMEVKTVSCSNINETCKKKDSDLNQKRKKAAKKESKPNKKILPPLRTPRTEVVERKGALLEALIGDLMRNERNTITQCICYIRNNMNRFCKIEVA